MSFRFQGPKTKKPILSDGAFDITGQLPILPHTCACSTIGAERLTAVFGMGTGDA